jgi:hypothetical protein
VTLLVLLRPEPQRTEDSDCLPATFTRRVELPAPLGTRALRDASKFPPALLGRG